MDFEKVQDSGKRQEFNTGSVRDTAEGKGTPNLIAGEVFGWLWTYYTIEQFKEEVETPVDLTKLIRYMSEYSTFQEKRQDNNGLVLDMIFIIMLYIAQRNDKSLNSAMTELAQHYENGAKKYSSHNWRKGQPVSRYYDSASRHLWKLIDGKLDENHAAAFLWNLVGIVQTKFDVQRGILSKELDNFPTTYDEVFPQKENRPNIEKGV